VDDSFRTLNVATEGIGRAFPQHQTMGQGYDYDAPDSVHAFRHHETPDFVPNLETIVIEPGARLTDLLSSVPLSNHALLVSERLYSLLLEFQLPPHRYIPAPMVRKGYAVPGYGVLHVPHLQRVTGEEATPLEISTLLAAHDDTRELDLVVLHRPARVTGWHLSSRLADRLVHQHVSGIRIGRSKLRRT